MKYLLLLFCLFSISAYAKSIDCNKHKLYCQIVNNYKAAGKRSINHKYAMRISNIIYKYSKQGIVVGEFVVDTYNKKCDAESEVERCNICGDFSYYLGFVNKPFVSGYRIKEGDRA